MNVALSCWTRLLNAFVTTQTVAVFRLHYYSLLPWWLITVSLHFQLFRGRETLQRGAGLPGDTLLQQGNFSQAWGRPVLCFKRRIISSDLWLSVCDFKLQKGLYFGARERWVLFQISLHLFLPRTVFVWWETLFWSTGVLLESSRNEAGCCGIPYQKVWSLPFQS